MVANNLHWNIQLTNTHFLGFIANGFISISKTVTILSAPYNLEIIKVVAVLQSNTFSIIKMKIKQNCHNCTYPQYTHSILCHTLVCQHNRYIDYLQYTLKGKEINFHSQFFLFKTTMIDNYLHWNVQHSNAHFLGYIAEGFMTISSTVAILSAFYSTEIGIKYF